MNMAAPTMTHQLWRWRILRTLVGCLLAIGYQWRISGGLDWLHQFETILAWQHLGLFMLGWLIGGLLLWVDDRWSQKWYDSPPLTRSVGFFLALVAVGIIVVTSAGSAIGNGLVMSMLTGLLCEIWCWQAEPLAFRHRFLHDIRSEAVEDLEQRWQGKWGIVAGLAWLAVVLLSLI